MTEFVHDYVVEMICEHKRATGKPMPKAPGDGTTTLVDRVIHRLVDDQPLAGTSLVRGKQSVDGQVKLSFGRLDWLSEGDSLQTWVEVIERRLEELNVSEATKSEIRRDPRQYDALLKTEGSSMEGLRWRFQCPTCDFTWTRANSVVEPILEKSRAARLARIPLHTLP